MKHGPDDDITRDTKKISSSKKVSVVHVGSEYMPALPRDVLQVIFSHLEPQVLLNAELVSKLWQAVSNRPVLWRNLINQYFPFLKEQTVQQYNSDPKALFVAHYQKIVRTLDSELRAFYWLAFEAILKNLKIQR